MSDSNIPHSTDFGAVWLDELNDRVGADRWVLLRREGDAVSVEATRPRTVDALYEAVWPLLEARGDGVHYVRTRADLGDVGRRLVVGGVGGLFTGVACHRGVTVVFENADERRLAGVTEVDLLPSPEFVATHWPAVLAARRWSAELLALRKLLPEILTAAPERGVAADLIGECARGLGAAAALTLEHTTAGLLCRGEWQHAGQWRHKSAMLPLLTWEEVERDPRAALAAAARELGLPRERRWRHALAHKGRLLLGLEAGLWPPSHEVLDLLAVVFAIVGSWRSALLDAEQNAHLAERARLATVVHEGGIQYLTNVAVQLELLAGDMVDEEHAAEVHSVRAAVLETLDSLRATVVDLSDRSLEGPPVNIAETLRRSVCDYAAQWGLDVEFVPEGEERGISRANARFLHHAVHEALVNVRRHADVAHARVCLRFREATIEVSVSDKGAGFNVHEVAARPDSSVHGLGLLRREVGNLDGVVDVSSAPGQGTVVRTEIAG